MNRYLTVSIQHLLVSGTIERVTNYFSILDNIALNYCKNFNEKSFKTKQLNGILFARIEDRKLDTLGEITTEEELIAAGLEFDEVLDTINLLNETCNRG